MREPILVSACLLGLSTRYDGASKRNQTVLDWLARERLLPIPVCPEQLAGLPTPREKTRFSSGDGRAVVEGTGQVVTFSGRIMNECFLHGANEALRIALLAGCRRAMFKERSPSCGVHRVHCGEEMITGTGVTTALLTAAGFSVLSEDDLRQVG
jgi:uncharacterized protein YbbK (DUF523 family)